MWKSAKFVRAIEPGEEHGVIGVQLKDTGEILILEDGDRIRIPYNGTAEAIVRVIELDPPHTGEYDSHSVGSLKSCISLSAIVGWKVGSFIIVIDNHRYAPNMWGPELWVED